MFALLYTHKQEQKPAIWYRMCLPVLACVLPHNRRFGVKHALPDSVQRIHIHMVHRNVPLSKTSRHVAAPVYLVVHGMGMMCIRWELLPPFLDVVFRCTAPGSSVFLRLCLLLKEGHSRVISRGRTKLGVYIIPSEGKLHFPVLGAKTPFIRVGGGPHSNNQSQLPLHFYVCTKMKEER